MCRPEVAWLFATESSERAIIMDNLLNIIDIYYLTIYYLFKFLKLKIAWKAILLVTPYIRVKRGCAGINSIIFILPGGQYITHEINQVQPSRLIKDIYYFLSEGILSFVEYAPRLLIVLPSRQFQNFNLFTIL